MKTKILLFTVFGLFISFLISAQNIGNGKVVEIPYFNAKLSSGLYYTSRVQTNPVYPAEESAWPQKYLFVMRYDDGDPNTNYQLQISSPFGTYDGKADRIFFRKIANTGIYPEWHEFATRGRNVFTGNQYINGTVYANLVKVETTRWSDFVFAEDYVLPTLEEVALHIKEYKHLPGIPSEKEAIKNGVDLLDISTKLLQKVEELTLYTIQQQQRIEVLEGEIKSMKESR